MNMVIFVLQNTLFFMIPLMIVALGGLFSEKSGVVNIALEGKMVLGAFMGIVVITNLQNASERFTLSGQVILLLGLFAAMVTGVVISLFHAYASINLRANQIISGVAINMFAPAFAVFFSFMLFDTQNVRFINQFRIESVPLLGRIPFVGTVLFSGAYITTYLGFLILAISVFVLYHTRFGLRLRACGEHPQAADSVGISVPKMRYAGVLISGALAGMGGLIWVIPISNIFSGSVSGYGFLALAVLIFGNWKPLRICLAAFFFGLMQTLAHSHAAIGFLNAMDIPAHFYRMAPYVATLVVLAFTSKNTAAPKAVGQPYDKGGR